MSHLSRQIGCLLLFFLFWTTLPSKTFSEFYRYVNKDGKAVFVDDISKIPPEYLEQLKTYKEKYDHLSKEQRAKLIEKERRMELDQRQKKSIADKIDLTRPQKRLSGKPLQTRVRIDKNRVLVPVTLGYKGRETITDLILDTGASIIALHQETAKSLQIQRYKKSKMRVVGGDLVDTGIVKLDYVKVGPLVKKDLYAGIIEYKGNPIPYSGLLGMNFLRDFEFSIDYDNKLITWNTKSN